MKDLRINILFILPSLKAGGAERIISFIAKNLDKSFFNITLLVIGYEKDVVFDINGVNTVFLNKTRLYKATKDIFKYIKNNKPNIVMSSIGHVNILMGLFSIYFQNIKFIAREASVNNVMQTFSSKKQLPNWVKKALYNRLDMIVCQSKDMRDEFIKILNVAHAINVDNATTANFTDSIINGNIRNSTFTNGIINGAILRNVDLTGAAGASKWINGVDGLYPEDGAIENVMIGGTDLASSTISLESNGTLRAVEFVGDFSNVSNITFNQEWNDQGNYLFPFDFAGNKGILIGGNTLATADTIFNADGSVVINEQAQNSDTRVEGQTHTFLFHTDASANRVSIKTGNPRSSLEINGSTAYVSNLVSVGVATGLNSSAIQNSRVIFVQSSGVCDVDLTASPQIAAGVDGQIITLIGRYSDEIITLHDGDGLALNNNISVSLKAKDSITLMYSSIAGEWIEIHRTNYLERIGDSLNRGTCT
jgi:hypothetical protein